MPGRETTRMAHGSTAAIYNMTYYHIKLYHINYFVYMIFYYYSECRVSLQAVRVVRSHTFAVGLHGLSV